MLTLRLVQVPSGLVRGVYDGKMPARALWAHPSAFGDLLAVLPRVVLSDLYRSPEASLAAMQAKTGVQPPAYSHHGYGGAFDVDIGQSIKLGGFGSRVALDEFLAEHNWPMFWIKPGANAPGSRPDSETWHHSHVLGTPTGRSTEAAAEQWIQDTYGPALRPDDAECQRMLKKLGLYHGEIDGALGPISRAASAAFQRAWLISAYAGRKGETFAEGILGPVSRRVLAFVSADRDLTPSP